LATFDELRGDPALQKAFSEEAWLLVACPQLWPPVAGSHVFCSADKHLLLGNQTPKSRTVFSATSAGDRMRCNAKQDNEACPIWMEATRFARSDIQEKHSGELSQADSCCSQQHSSCSISN
tara:strand:- start:1798 stop:2160 length:363 start_codon:yes stop_codon:yes gene_type:complete